MEQFSIHVKIGIKLRELYDLLRKSEAPEAQKTLNQIELAKAIWESPQNQKKP